MPAILTFPILAAAFRALAADVALGVLAGLVTIHIHNVYGSKGDVTGSPSHALDQFADPGKMVGSPRG